MDSNKSLFFTPQIKLLLNRYCSRVRRTAHLLHQLRLQPALIARHSRANVVLTPSITAIIMDSRPSHVPLVDTPELPSTVQDRAIIPDNQVSRGMPRHAGDILLLACVVVESFHQLRRLLRRHALDVMQMGANIQVHAARWLMQLRNAVVRHGRRARV